MNAILIRVEILPKSVVLSDYFVPRQTSGISGSVLIAVTTTVVLMAFGG